MNVRMTDFIYYYVLISNPYKVESTSSLDELISLLYESKADFISDVQRKDLKLIDGYLDDLRKRIGKYENKVPLYDIRSNHIFLINKDNVYHRFYYDDYRFITKDFYQDLVDMKNPSQNDLENKRFLSYYNLDVLFKTYVKIFYQSFVVDEYITDCKRPSFSQGMEHISPYYKINELYYLVYDWNLTDKVNLSEKEIKSFCKQISQYDIPAQTLIDHQMYIYDSKAIGLVKHYSLFGSYYINMYLRKNQCCPKRNKSYEGVIRNLDIENQIKIMINLIKSAPSFIKAHTVYRFIERDEFLSHLKVGDIYEDTSFMSTTRNPFYYKENYTFGYILIKIKLPANVKGVGLCIESYSNFPNEEEIVLPPSSRFMLNSVKETEELSRFEGIFDLKVKKKYEFTYIDNDYNHNDSKIIIEMPMAKIELPSEINFKHILKSDENIKYVPMSDRLGYFRDTYIKNIYNQFSCIINEHRYIFNMDAYDSSSVYKPFFYYEIKDGIMITTSNPKYGNINLMIELGSDIHVNYYFRFSVTDPSIVVDLNQVEWIEWLSILAYLVGANTVNIHSNYILRYNKDDTIEQKQLKTLYTFSQNIYVYLKEKKKMYEFDEVTPKFDYGQLDYLFQIPLSKVIKPLDRNELPRIAKSSQIKNVGDFYIYIVENYPKFIRVLEEKLDDLYEPEVNPFKNISYKLDPWFYLYNHGLINRLPSDKEFAFKKGAFKKLISDKKIPKFKNRLRSYLLNM